jgi:hypothetical protein
MRHLLKLSQLVVRSVEKTKVPAQEARVPVFKTGTNLYVDPIYVTFRLVKYGDEPPISNLLTDPSCEYLRVMASLAAKAAIVDTFKNWLSVMPATDNMFEIA